MTFQSLTVLALGNVGKHFVVHLVCSAVRYSLKKEEENTDAHVRIQNSNLRVITD